MKSPVKKSNQETLGKWRTLLRKLLLKARSEQALQDLLSDLLTPQELTSLAERIAILESLARGDTLREVARKVHVSVGKVERGSNVIRYGKVDWRRIFSPGR